MTGQPTGGKTKADIARSATRRAKYKKYEFKNSTNCNNMVSPGNAPDLIATDIREGVDKLAKDLIV